MTKIKLWISDIDGTLMNYDGTYTHEMVSVIEKVKNKGVKLVIATGRMFMGAQYAAKNFNLDTPVVCYQGAVVRTKEKILWQAPIDNDISLEIIDYLRKNKIHTHIYNDDTLYVEDDNKRIMHEYCNGRGTTYKYIDSFDKLKINDLPKILGVIEDNDIMQKIKKELQEKYKGILTIVQSSNCYLEITDKNASKGNALNFLKKYWNLSDDEVLASGDQDNDIDLLKNAGIRISVGNNSLELQKVAQYHCKSVDSNELVKYIEEFVL